MSVGKGRERKVKPDKCKCCNGRNLIFSGEKDGYTFWECRGCNFIFTDLNYSEIVSSYEKGYHGLEEGAPQKGWAKSIEFLDPALSRKPGTLTILDFGCGESKVPQRLREDNHKVIAADIVPPFEEHPDRLTGDILDLHLPLKHFDLIYAYQVFEHVAEPQKIIKRLCELLKDDGHLLIHTDMETPERFQDDFVNWWYVLPPDHCSYFRHNTFEKMLNHLGFSIAYKNPKTVLAARCSV